MSSTPGSKIRRLISQRGHRSGGHRRAVSGFDVRIRSDSDEGVNYVLRDGLKNSWHIVSSRKQAPPRPDRAYSVHDVFGPLPPVPALTTRSSASSLCSNCEHNADAASQQIALRRPCLCDASSKKVDTSQESLPPPSNNAYEDDRPSPQILHEDRQSDFYLLRRSNESIVSDLSTSDRKYLSPLPFEDRARRSFDEPEVQKTVKEYSDDIQRLVQEVDEAFKAGVNTTPGADTERTTKSEETPRTTAPEAEETPMSQSFTERPGPTTPDISPILQSPLKVLPLPQSQPQLSTSTSIGATPALPALAARSPSVSKRKKGKKGVVMPKSPKAVKPLRKAVINKHAPRWTLTENMTELFSGRLFNKVEVDEMLTEAQLEEFKRRRRLSQFRLYQQQQQQQEQKQKQQLASEAAEAAEQAAEVSTKTAPDDAEPVPVTPIEPFHLEDLPARINSAGVRLQAESAEDEAPVPGPTFFVSDDEEQPDSQHHNFEASSSSDRDELFLGESPTSALSDEAAAAGKGFQPPSPKKGLRNLMAIRQQPPALPSIPEASSASTPSGMRSDELFLTCDPQPEQQQQQLQEVQRGRQDSSGSGSGSIVDEDDEYVYFRASPYTLAAPRFRHGPIRVAKSDLLPEPTLGGADDGLDWTAFQMAILGGAGDWNSESDDTIHRRTVEEIDDLVDWWDSFGFAGTIGGLQTEDPEAAALARARAEAEAEAAYAAAAAAANAAAVQQSPPSPTSTISANEYYPDVSYSDAQQDSHAYSSAHQRWETQRRQAAMQGLGLPGPKTTSPYVGGTRPRADTYSDRDRHSSKIYAGPGIDVMGMGMGTGLGISAGADGGKRESLASMPQSPMLDLRVIRGVGGHGGGHGPDGEDDVDVVPMGYNLGHDLGDFLKWEAEHVYAGGYYSSQDVM